MMRRRSRRAGFLLTIAAASMMTVAATSAHAASEAGSPSVPVRHAARPSNASTVVAEVEWGIKEGKPYVNVIKGKLVTGLAPTATMSSASAAVTTTACHDYISNVTRYGDFYWTTEETCIGNFGWHEINTQLWRSSWSGPRGYSAWAQTPHTSVSYIHEDWGIGCNNGHGTYDYYPVMEGYASGIGYGPTVRSDNQLRQDCGPSI